MSTLTTRTSLYKPAADGSEDVNVVTDVNNNLDSIDTKLGALQCTSSTRPGTPYNGQFIRETDTGKMYCYDGTDWRQLLFNTAAFGSAITVSSGDISATSGAINATRASSTNAAFNGAVTGDTEKRLIIDAAGKHLWGPGSTTPGDTNLYRSAADTLKTDDNFLVGGDLTVTGNAVVGGNLTADAALLNGTTVRPQLSATATVANSNAETVVATLNIPAGDAVAGAVYHIKAWGLASVTGTPTMTWRARLGGVAGTLVYTTGAATASSGVTNHPWEMDLMFTCLTTGASGTSRGFANVRESLTLAGGSGPYAAINRQDGTTANVTFDTTVSKDLVVTVQWSAASASNTLTCYIAYCGRLA